MVKITIDVSEEAAKLLSLPEKCFGDDHGESKKDYIDIILENGIKSWSGEEFTIKKEIESLLEV